MPGGPAYTAHDPVDRVPVQHTAMVSSQALVAADVLRVGSGPGGKQVHNLGCRGTYGSLRSLPSHLPRLPVGDRDADGLVVCPSQRLADRVEALAAILPPDPATPVLASRIRGVA